jgi:hypothetical protein
MFLIGMFLFELVGARLCADHDAEDKSEFSLRGRRGVKEAGPAPPQVSSSPKSVSLSVPPDQVVQVATTVPKSVCPRRSWFVPRRRRSVPGDVGLSPWSVPVEAGLSPSKLVSPRRSLSPSKLVCPRRSWSVPGKVGLSPSFAASEIADYT